MCDDEPGESRAGYLAAQSANAAEVVHWESITGARERYLNSQPQRGTAEQAAGSASRKIFRVLKSDVRGLFSTR